MGSGISTSRIPGFYKLSLGQRLQTLAELCGLDAQELQVLKHHMGYSPIQADQMIENAVGILPIPLGMAVNFKIDGGEYIVPMAIEEPSVLAAASNAARLFRHGQGISTEATEPIMIGQIQLLEIAPEDIEAAQYRILQRRQDILDRANSFDATLCSYGGGARDLQISVFRDTHVGPMVVVYLHVDVRDAMGANAINTMAEGVAPYLEELTGGRSNLRILSNLADKRLIRVRAEAPITALLKGEGDARKVAQGVVEASVLAEIDPYRAATHNKGIMNGIDAVLMATGQDYRAVEAGAHSYAARSGVYSALSTWRIEDDLLVGTMELPMAVGIVGGITRTHPTVKVNLKILGITTATELARIAASAGLAQNFAAIFALSTEGIQRGHMSLHARNIALSAGAQPHEVEEVVAEMRRHGRISISAAKGYLAQLRSR